jgi:Protein of unknown function (DUF3443)
MNAGRMNRLLPLFLLAALAAGCGGGTPTSSSSSGKPAPPPAANVQPIVVNTGPTAAPPINAPALDQPFTSVTVCVPGTSNCQTISGILVDTGSSGLRILSSALTLSLPQQTGSSGNAIVECFQFVSSVTWGPVRMADVSMAGEKANAVPLQVIGDPSFSTIPSACSSVGPPAQDLAGLGANGIVGVGNFIQDCGLACATTGPANPGIYYACPTSTTCAVTAESLAQQVPNPVALFAIDNNGVLIELPAVSGAEPSVSGSLIFGIGTQSNNALGGATVFGLDPVTGNFTTISNGQTLTDAGFLDTGSNGIFFLDSAATGIPVCTNAAFFYCPSSTLNLSATNVGTNGAVGAVNFTVGNALSLTSNANDAAVQGLAGPFPGTFDWGFPFFYGRHVFTAFEGRTTPGGTGPYVAY